MTEEQIDQQVDKAEKADKELTKEIRRVENIGGERNHRLEILFSRYGYELGRLSQINDQLKGGDKNTIKGRD